MARNGASWRYVLGWWASIAGLAAVLALVGITLFSKDGLQTAANVAQVVGIPLLFPTLLVPLLLWRRRAVAAKAATSADVASYIWCESLCWGSRPGSRSAVTMRGLRT
ncbi:hypothetical protein ACIBQX_30795 [Nonomuraea sp. NPDC049714]|uniref:hypothetical protein n=1 Tax=Nonomuraea sp. NPDC049714 TaxID=3364357 RepID=UPI00379D919B